MHHLRMVSQDSVYQRAVPDEVKAASYGWIPSLMFEMKGKRCFVSQIATAADPFAHSSGLADV